MADRKIKSTSTNVSVTSPTKITSYNKVSESKYKYKPTAMSVVKMIFMVALIVLLSSFGIKGYVDSAYTSKEETTTITHTYNKQIGTEIIGGNFDDFTYDNFGELTFNKKIYFKKQVPTGSEIISITSSSSSGNGYYGLRFVARNFKLYDDNDNLLYSYSYNTDFILLYSFRYKAYSKNLEYLYFSIYDLTGVQATVFICDIIGNQVSNNSNYNIKYPSASYFTYSNYYNSISNIAFYGLNTSRITFSDNFFNIILNDNLVYDDVIEVPIYETTTYSYDVKDVGYDWNIKLKQVSRFRPLFNSYEAFINEDWLKLQNYISYTGKFTGLVTDDDIINDITNRYYSDERLAPLYNYFEVHISHHYNLFKAYNEYYSYISFDENIDYTTPELAEAYNYAYDNYLTNYNHEEYLKKYEITFNDILIVLSFPLQIVYNLIYNFGVLISIITIW